MPGIVHPKNTSNSVSSLTFTGCTEITWIKKLCAIFIIQYYYNIHNTIIDNAMLNKCI